MFALMKNEIYIYSVNKKYEKKLFKENMGISIWFLLE